jgi:hypothetical protein
MSDDATAGDGNDINRKQWVELYERGFELGTRERSLDPAKRRDRVEPRLDADHGHSDVEIEALQAGYELGRDEGFPGAEIDVDKRANSAFDRSGYAADLSDWGDQ